MAAFNRPQTPSIPSALASSASKSGVPLIDPRTGGQLFSGPELLDFLAKRVAGGADQQILLRELASLGFGPNDSMQILNLLPGWPGTANATQTPSLATAPAQQTTAAMPRPVTPTSTSGTAAPQPPQDQSAQPAGGGRYVAPPRSGAGILQSLVSGAPAQMVPVPQPRGNKWHDALPMLGASIGNAFSGAAIAQAQATEKEQSAKRLQMEQEQQARLKTESEQRMAATEFEIGMNQVKMSRFADEQFGNLPPDQAVKLAEQGVSKTAFAMAVANKNYGEASRILGALPTTDELVRQRRAAGFKAAGLDESLASIYDSPYQARQDALVKMQLAAAQRDQDDIAAGRVPAEAKPQLLSTYTREIGDIDAGITSLTDDLAKARAAEAQVANLQKEDPDKVTALMNYMAEQGITKFDTKTIENQIANLKATRASREAAIKSLYPGQKDLVSALPDTTTQEVDTFTATKAKIDEYLKTTFPGAAGGMMKLTSEQEAAKVEMEQIAGAPAPKGSGTFGSPGTIAENVKSGIVSDTKTLINAPIQTAGAITYGAHRIQRALNLIDLNDPELIDVYLKVRAEAPSLAKEEALGIAMDRIFMQRFPTLSPDFVTGKVPQTAPQK